jgi:hypothetical protein
MTAMRLTTIQFGSLLSYSPKGTSKTEELSRTLRSAVKGDWPIGVPPEQPKPTSEVIAEVIQKDLATFPFADFFQNKPILVPTPSSSLMKPGTLWMPQRLANAMVNRGLGARVVECLNRVTAVKKAATSKPSERPKAIEHYSTIEVQTTITEPAEIVLIDDVVTRGATLLGAANRLADAFPNTLIRGFAALRTMSGQNTFKALQSPCIGTIRLSGSETFRVP